MNEKEFEELFCGHSISLEEVLKSCRYYHREEQPPESYDGKQKAIWQSEKTACKFMMLEDEVSTNTFVRMVVNLIAKWCPYNYFDILEVYKTENPEYKAIIESVEKSLY